jgi:hypothetical protein
MPRATAPLTAFRASGRLIVMTATPSLTSVRTGSDIGVIVLTVGYVVWYRLPPKRITAKYM